MTQELKISDFITSETVGRRAFILSHSRGNWFRKIPFNYLA